MDSMPRPRPPHLHRDVSRHGETRWYVRIGKGKRHRIKGEYGSQGFLAQYRAIMAGEEQPEKGESRSGSLAWLVSKYRESIAWRQLALSTRKVRENIFKHIITSAGDAPFKNITRKTIQSGIDRRRETPAAARHFLDVTRGLFRWALEADYVAHDPTAGIKVKKPKTEGFKPWDSRDIAAFRTRWQTGTRERLAFDLFLFTGLRRGDVALLGRQHIKNGILEIKTEKTGEIVIIPVHPDLAASIEATQRTGLALISTANGIPMTKESLGNWFREACNAAGVTNKSAHGIRKAAAAIAAESGATEKELDAMFGWSGGGMAKLYTRSAERTRLAMAGATKVREAKTATSIPSPQINAPSPKK